MAYEIDELIAKLMEKHGAFDMECFSLFKKLEQEYGRAKEGVVETTYPKEFLLWILSGFMANDYWDDIGRFYEDEAEKKAQDIVPRLKKLTETFLKSPPPLKYSALHRGGFKMLSLWF